MQLGVAARSRGVAVCARTMARLFPRSCRNRCGFDSQRCANLVGYLLDRKSKRASLREERQPVASPLCCHARNENAGVWNASTGRDRRSRGAVSVSPPGRANSRPARGDYWLTTIPGLGVAGLAPMLANTLTANCCARRSTRGVGINVLSRPHIHWIEPVAKTLAPLGCV